MCHATMTHQTTTEEGTRSSEHWHTPVKRVLTFTLLILVAIACLWLALPSIFTGLLVVRFKRAVDRTIAASPSDPFYPSIYPISGVISRYDSSDHVLDALWLIARSADSTKEEIMSVEIALSLLAEDHYVYFLQEGHTEDDWRAAMRRFFDRWHPSPAPGNPTVSANFHAFEAEWRKKHP